MKESQLKELESNLSKLVFSVSDYAKRKDVTFQCVKHWIKEKKVQTIMISGRKFIVEEQK